MSAARQQTLAGEVALQGLGLHSGVEVRVVCRPMPADSGLLLRRADVAGAEAFPARHDRLEAGALQRQTTLGDAAGRRIATVEHLLSACVGLGIDNLQVDVYGEEVPLLDGSAAPIVDAFLAAGLTAQSAARREVALEAPLTYTEGDAELTYLPGGDFRATYFADYNSEVVGVQAFHFSGDTDYAADVAPARTFVMFEDLQKLRSANLIKGGSLDNALVITSTGYMNGPLRFADEIARHKLLDLLGDLSLLGARLRGHVLAYKSGHQSHVHFVQEIAQRLVA